MTRHTSTSNSCHSISSPLSKSTNNEVPLRTMQTHPVPLAARTRTCSHPDRRHRGHSPFALCTGGWARLFRLLTSLDIVASHVLFLYHFCTVEGAGIQDLSARFSIFLGFNFLRKLQRPFVSIVDILHTSARVGRCCKLGEVLGRAPNPRRDFEPETLNARRSCKTSSDCGSWYEPRQRHLSVNDNAYGRKVSTQLKLAHVSLVVMQNGYLRVGIPTVVTGGIRQEQYLRDMGLFRISLP
ncbi:hypothetical protein FPV67DRAFT_1654486 [Lyophyllum atratum]|nr:hypothetical protein FPV67DRAFT_1654486 [Lyophyllum atratum]